MKDNPYLPSKVETTPPIRVTCEQIIAGKTTAGPLLVLLAKYPVVSSFIGGLLLGAIMLGIKCLLVA